MTPWLSIVGIGEEGIAALNPPARALIDDAEVLIGGTRHLAMLPQDDRERLTWPSPLKALLGEIEARRGRRVCVLATGDPQFYGVGVTLARRFPREEMLIVPGVSAFSLAAARLGWNLAEVEMLTLHGRPLALLHPYLQPGARLILLSDSAATPGAVAELLRARGYGASRLTVLEHMGGAAERRIDGTAADWAATDSSANDSSATDSSANDSSKNDLADFNTLAVECPARPEGLLLPRSPGLPDEAFRHDGQMTKREVRAVTLAALAPVPGALLWDVGAGCGSIAIEWMRAAPRARAIAIERKEARRAMIAENAAALGTPTLDVVAGEAPAALAGLAPPDAVFIGGGAAAEGLIEACWDALKPGGRLAANLVTLEGERRIAAWHDKHGGALTRLAVSRAEPVGPHLGWRPLMPVTHYSVVKP